MSKKYITDYIDVNGGTQTTAPRNTISDYAIFVSAVQGTGYYKGILGIGESANGINAGILAYDGGTGGQQDLVFVTSNDIFSAPVEAMRIDSNGNTTIKGLVGIGTSPISSNLLNMQFDNTDPDADYYFAQRVDGNFSGADNTTGDREQGGIYLDIDSSADGDASNEHRLYGIYSDVKFTGFSDVSTSLYGRVENNNSTEVVTNMIGTTGYAYNDCGASGGVSTTIGVHGFASIEDNGTATTTKGIEGFVSVSATRAANVGGMYAGKFEIAIDSPNAITYGDAVVVDAVLDNNEGTVPTGTNSYLFKGDYQGTRYATNSWGLYVAGDKHYLEGNVGIGTSSPEHKLVAMGNIGFGEGSYNGGVYANISTTSVDENWGLRVQKTSSVDDYNIRLQFYPEAGTTRKIGLYNERSNDWILYGDGNTSSNDVDVIIPNGNLGIGTVGPVSKLHVHETSFLGGDTNDTLLIQTLSNPGGSGGNNLYVKEWARRRTTGTNWTTWIYHNAIQVDASFGTPGTNTRTFWERDPYSAKQYFGSAAYYTLTVDGANNRVGIGTTSPSEKLHIDGGNLRLEATTDGANGLLRLYDASNVESGQIYPHSGDLRIYSANDILFNNVGNVGIGTTSPSSKLRVKSSGSAEEQITVESSGNTNTLVAIGQSDNGNIGGAIELNNTNGAVGVHLDGHGTSYFNRGNVGIGTTSPSGKLDVNGQIVLSSDTEHYIEKDTTSLVTGSAVETTTISGRNIDLYAYDDVNLRAGTGDKITFHAGGGEKMRIDGSGRVIIGATSPANSSYKISVSNSNGGFVSNASGAGDASFYSTSSTIGWHFYGDNGTTNTFHVTNAGQGYFAGNVGIGTTSPSADLHVRDSGQNSSITATIPSWWGGIFERVYTTTSYAAVGIIGGSTSVGGKGILYLGNANDVENTYLKGGNNLLEINGYEIQYTGGVEHNWYTSGTFRMRLNSSGNLGIGTTSPTTKLWVEGGSSTLATFNSTGTNNWTIWRENGTVRGYIGVGDNGALFTGATTDSFSIRSEADLHLGGNGNNLQMTLNGSGVGIGTTSPSVSLEVNAEHANTSGIHINGYSNNEMLVLHSRYDQASGGMFFLRGADGAESTIGSIRFVSNQFRINADIGNLAIQTSGSTAITVDSSQNVGIGTTSPTAKLEVNGSIKHNGLSPTAGSNIDQITEFTKSLQLTADTWTDTGISGTDIGANGVYILYMLVDDYNVGGGHYSEIYSATMSWRAGNTNSSNIDEIFLHRAGHAPNSGEIQLRTVRQSSSVMKLQIKSNSTYSAADNIVFKFRRMI